MASPVIALLFTLTLSLATIAATPTPATRFATLPGDTLYEALGRWYTFGDNCVSVDISLDSNELDRVCFSIEDGRSVCSNISTAHDGWISPMGDLMSVLHKSENLLVLGYEGPPREGQETYYATVLARDPFPRQADLDALRAHLQSTPYVVDLPAAEDYRTCHPIAVSSA